MIKIHNSIYTNIDNILRYRNFMIFIFLSFFQDGVRKTRMLCHIKKVVARIFHYLSYYLKNMTYYRAISFPLCQNHFLFFFFRIWTCLDFRGLFVEERNRCTRYVSRGKQRGAFSTSRTCSPTTFKKKEGENKRERLRHACSGKI